VESATASPTRGSRTRKRQAGRTKPPYSPTFKPEAVAQVRPSGAPRARIERNLGMSEATLRCRRTASEERCWRRPT
jgi:transposase-like protein